MHVRRGGGLSTSISHRTLGFLGDTVNEIIARISGLIERAIGKEVHLIFAQDWHSHDDNEFEIGYYYKFRCALLLYLIVSYPFF